jgi:iron complex transport system ATP-binding protein
VPELSLKGFSAGYRRGSAAISGLDFTLPGGEIWGLLGPNGAGKSTLMKGILGFPWLWRKGSVLADGKPFEGFSEREKASLIGYLPQDPPVPQGLTVTETVLLGRHPFRSPWATDSATDREAAKEVMEECGILHLAGRLTANLSGGERRMVFLASVLVQKPMILLLDEPGSGLDYRYTAMLWEILERLASRGVSVFASTHRLAMAGEHFSGAMFLSGGRCIAAGSPEEIFTPGIMSAVYGIPLSVTRDSGAGGWSVSSAGDR